MGQAPSTTVSPGTRRRSQRVLLQVPVLVRGTNAEGREFEEGTETLSISAHGALVKLQAKLVSGAKVIVKHEGTQEEQETKVIFMGTTRGGKTEVGLEFASPRPSFWRVAFPPEDWSPKHPDARAVSFREK